MSIDWSDGERLLSPEGFRYVRVMTRLWTQFARLCDPEHLETFLELHASILAVESEAVQRAYESGYESAAAWNDRLKQYELDRGVALGIRWYCEANGLVVPDFVVELEQRVLDHRVRLAAERRAAPTLAAMPESREVH